VFVLFAPPDAYISPNWYPSKAADGKVVPTWNYEVVHAHGTARIHDDVDWVRQIVTDLTTVHEGSEARGEGHEAWAVTDAPPAFIDKQLRGIVGVEIEISLLEGKQKLSQNRPAEDQVGVIAGLSGSSSPTDQAVVESMRALHP